MSNNDEEKLVAASNEDISSQNVTNKLISHPQPHNETTFKIGVMGTKKKFLQFYDGFIDYVKSTDASVLLDEHWKRNQQLEKTTTTISPTVATARKQRPLSPSARLPLPLFQNVEIIPLHSVYEAAATTNTAPITPKASNKNTKEKRMEDEEVLLMESIFPNDEGTEGSSRARELASQAPRVHVLLHKISDELAAVETQDCVNIGTDFYKSSPKRSPYLSQSDGLDQMWKDAEEPMEDDKAEHAQFILDYLHWYSVIQDEEEVEEKRGPSLLLFPGLDGPQILTSRVTTLLVIDDGLKQKRSQQSQQFWSRWHVPKTCFYIVGEGERQPSLHGEGYLHSVGTTVVNSNSSQLLLIEKAKTACGVPDTHQMSIFTISSTHEATKEVEQSKKSNPPSPFLTSPTTASSATPELMQQFIQQRCHGRKNEDKRQRCWQQFHKHILHDTVFKIYYIGGLCYVRPVSVVTLNKCMEEEELNKQHLEENAVKDVHYRSTKEESSTFQQVVYSFNSQDKSIFSDKESVTCLPSLSTSSSSSLKSKQEENIGEKSREGSNKTNVANSSTVNTSLSLEQFFKRFPQLPSTTFVEEIHAVAAMLQEAFRHMSLFGFDVIFVPTAAHSSFSSNLHGSGGGGDSALCFILDVNFFPGFKGVPDVYQVVLNEMLRAYGEHLREKRA